MLNYKLAEHFLILEIITAQLWETSIPRLKESIQFLNLNLLFSWYYIIIILNKIILYITILFLYIKF